jgi:hypothetical protein
MMIFDGTLDMTTTPPGTTEQVTLNYALVNGVETFSVAIGSGNVLVTESGTWDEATEIGTLTITDRSTTWTCTLSHGTGTCTGTGGQSFNL